MKKVISIMLVLAMACALFIIPAHAHEVEETVVPYALACPKCGANLIKKTNDVKSETVWNETVDGCTKNPTTHLHGYYYRDTYYDCYGCDYTRHISTTTVPVCQYD